MRRAIRRLASGAAAAAVLLYLDELRVRGLNLRNDTEALSLAAGLLSSATAKDIATVTDAVHGLKRDILQVVDQVDRRATALGEVNQRLWRLEQLVALRNGASQEILPADVIAELLNTAKGAGAGAGGDAGAPLWKLCGMCGDMAPAGTWADRRTCPTCGHDHAAGQSDDYVGSQPHVVALRERLLEERRARWERAAEARHA
jgi:hypothetical protein